MIVIISDLYSSIGMPLQLKPARIHCLSIAYADSIKKFDDAGNFLMVKLYSKILSCICCLFRLLTMNNKYLRLGNTTNKPEFGFQN